MNNVQSRIEKDGFGKDINSKETMAMLHHGRYRHAIKPIREINTMVTKNFIIFKIDPQ